MLRSIKTVALAAVAAAAFLFASQAHAGFSITLSDGVGDSISIDQAGTVTTTGTASATGVTGTQNKITASTVMVGNFLLTDLASQLLAGNNSPGNPVNGKIFFTADSATVAGVGAMTLTVTEMTSGGSFTNPTFPSVNLVDTLTANNFAGTDGDNAQVTATIIGGGANGATSPTVQINPGLAVSNSGSKVVGGFTAPYDLKTVTVLSVHGGDSFVQLSSEGEVNTTP